MNHSPAGEAYNFRLCFKLSGEGAYDAEALFAENVQSF